MGRGIDREENRALGISRLRDDGVDIGSKNEPKVIMYTSNQNSQTSKDTLSLKFRIRTSFNLRDSD